MLSPHRLLRGARSTAAIVFVSIALAGCVTSGQDTQVTASRHDPATIERYGARPNERFPMPATDISKVDPKWLRQQVSYNGPEQPGTIVIDTQSRFLYLVQDGGAAMRYGIGVGKEGLAFEGQARVGRKAEWPRWTPTSDMIARDPERYGAYSGGMDAGLDNPLGPRALYLFQGNRDTLFRIHGTTEPLSIGRAVSSGCIRLFNQDIIDLYARVPKDTSVVVLQDGPAMASSRTGGYPPAGSHGGGDRYGASDRYEPNDRYEQDDQYAQPDADPYGDPYADPYRRGRG